MPNGALLGPCTFPGSLASYCPDISDTSTPFVQNTLPDTHMAPTFTSFRDWWDLFPGHLIKPITTPIFLLLPINLEHLHKSKEQLMSSQGQLFPKLTPVLLPQSFSNPSQIIHLLPATGVDPHCIGVRASKGRDQSPGPRSPRSA